MYSGIMAIFLLIIANVFMTFAWYGHLQLKNVAWFERLNIFQIILISWGIAFLEYVFQVPANRYGIIANGGPFNLFELKIIQEFLSLSIFMVIAIFVFKTEKLAWNHFVGFALMLLAAFFIFKKW